MSATKFLLLTSLLLLHSPSLQAATLVKDTFWHGNVTITEDVVVPKGITLTIRPGSVIRIAVAENTKTEPVYLSTLTEITIRGKLIIEGTEKQPVLIRGVTEKPGSWSGIIVDHGTAAISCCRISHAETGVTSLGASVTLASATLSDNRYGLTAYGDNAVLAMRRSLITENDYGVFSFHGSRVTLGDSRVSGNRKRDTFTAQRRRAGHDGNVRLTLPDIPVNRRYDDEVFRGDTIWQGRIEVAGIIRIPEGSRLIIAPGSIIEFVRSDSNGDGIGENGIMVQGAIIAKGTSEQPIIFRSAEKEKTAGDWDAINIMNSASSRNLLEFCRIEHAYRAVHFHFSNVAVLNSFIGGNYRAIQFQESLVELRGNTIIGNRSGVQGRDSDIIMEDNLLADNYLGANFFRTTLTARNNRFIANWREGMRVREGITTVRSNLFDGNRFGLMLSDMFFGDYSGNVVSGNLETGLLVRNSDNLEIAGNAITLNGLTGISIQESRFLLRDNLITDNGERGIAVQAFDGVIRDNNLAANGRYAIDVDGAQDVAAPANWWGGENIAKIVLDKLDDPARGRCDTDTPLKEPVRFVWPLSTITTELRWRGIIAVTARLEIVKPATLALTPGTVVEFKRGAGMSVTGTLLAQGTEQSRILFTSATRSDADIWDEIQLEYATGSMIDHCVFEYATWGLHSHFTELTVERSIFRHNLGGVRFRSGPVRISGNLFARNGIGVRSYIGNAVITGNTIRNNEVGIFVRERGAGLTISGNNIHDNSNYSIRLGDFNTEDLNARGNWWGGGDPLAAIFDDRAEPGIGKVIIEPVLERKVEVTVDRIGPLP